jgi:3',5'-cyclic AMP phosphodiesterase CpdA
MPLQLQYASDLHLEFPANKEFLKRHSLQPVGDVLILAGDIVTFRVMDKHQDFFSYVADHFETTYWMPGNHEYYGYDLAQKCGVLKEAIRSNVFLVNNTTAIHGDVKLLFSTLWSKISPGHQWEIERNLNDFHVIKHQGYRLSAERYNELHEESMAFIEQELAQVVDEKLVVVSHHCPTFMNYPPQYKGSALNEAFAVELFDTIAASAIDYWIYGHHHYNTLGFNIGNTKLLTNQLGYVQLGEHGLFKKDECIVWGEQYA